MRRLKLWGGLIAIVILLIVIMQNTESVETSILFWRFSMPRALLLLLASLLGLIVGLLIAATLYRRGRKVESSSTVLVGAPAAPEGSGSSAKS